MLATYFLFVIISPLIISHTIHGTFVYLPTLKAIKINHSWIGKKLQVTWILYDPLGIDDSNVLGTTSQKCTNQSSTFVGPPVGVCSPIARLSSTKMGGALFFNELVVEPKNPFAKNTSSSHRIISFPQRRNEKTYPLKIGGPPGAWEIPIGNHYVSDDNVSSRECMIHDH